MRGTMGTTRSYEELSHIPTFEGRYDYLKIGSQVGFATFGGERYLNQRFYTSRQWRLARDFVIARDLGLDLGVPGFEIHDRIVVHHMNPLTIEDVDEGLDHILDPRFLITTTHATHNAIHYGDASLLPKPLIERVPGDTRLW